MKYKVGIIGVGMVGGAIAQTIECETVELSTFDKYNKARTKNWDKFLETSICFVCVPTPTVQGEQNISELQVTMASLSENGYRGVVVIKSTVLPGTCRTLQAKHPKLRIVHNPEFLCEKTAAHDFADQKVILFSGKFDDCREVNDFFYRLGVGNTRHYSQDFEVTEYAKYIHNCALPIQLSFLNEMKELICNDSVFNTAVDMAVNFGNLTRHHKVPGPDGKLGWGGICFTKDTQALSTFARKRNKTVHTLDGAIQTNRNYRSEEMDQ